MATLSESRLEGPAGDGVLGPESMKSFKHHLARFISNDVEKNDDERYVSDSESEQEPTSPGLDETSMQDLAEPSSSSTGRKRKEMLEYEDGIPEPATIVKRRRENEPELTTDSASARFSKASRPPIVVSRPMQKKEDHSLKQQAFYRSGMGKRSGGPLRNAVLEKIAELEEIAEKKRTKDSEKAKDDGDEKHDHPLLAISTEGLKENDRIETTHIKDTQQLAKDDDVEKEIVKTQCDGTKTMFDEMNEVLQIKAAKEVQKKARLTYVAKLGNLPTKLPTQDQIAALEHSMSTGPKYLGRTASTVHGYRHAKNWMTNGSTSQDLLLPSADTRAGYESHPHLTDLSQGQIIYMSGLHLTWLNPKHDEILSFSKELMFLLIHALGRHQTGQRNVTIQYINRDEAKTIEGEPAAFYDALDIYNIFEVPSWSGWTKYLKLALNLRKFTHEFLSHGIIKHNDTTLKQARLEDLVEDGLFLLFPELEAPHDHERCGLYTEQVVCRMIGFPPREALPF
jgi:hypothetical protein